MSQFQRRRYISNTMLWQIVDRGRAVFERKGDVVRNVVS